MREMLCESIFKQLVIYDAAIWPTRCQLTATLLAALCTNLLTINFPSLDAVLTEFESVVFEVGSARSRSVRFQVSKSLVTNDVASEGLMPFRIT